MAQSQYATDAQMQLLGITPAQYARFEASAPGCVTASLQASSSIADASLSSQFEMPLPTSPQGWDMSLTVHVCWHAAYSLYFQFGFNPSSPDWQLMTDRFDRAVKFFDGIAKKTITPLYTDSAGSDTSDRAGDFVISDVPVGFTQRGVTQPINGCTPGSFWWD